MTQRGFSLIEISVALAVLSIGLGGLSIALLSAIGGTADARYRTVAVTWTSSLAETILMNPATFGHYMNPIGASAGSCTPPTACRSSFLAAAEIQRWREAVRRELPGAEGLLCRDGTPDDGTAADPACDDAGALAVKLFWQVPRNDAEDDTGLRRQVSHLPW